MSKNNLIELKNPEPFVDDPITEIVRNGAKKLLAEALEAEIAGSAAVAIIFTSVIQNSIYCAAHFPQKNMKRPKGI